MAARRLLIVMLILLGVSTLAAALIPQRTLRDGNRTQSTTLSTTTTATAPEPPPGRSLRAKIVVGGRQVPIVASPLCAERKPRCEPLHVGDQLTLTVYSSDPAQLDFPEFGQSGFAASGAPVYFQLLLDSPGGFGILFADPESVPACRHAVGHDSPCVAAKIVVLTAAAARKAIARPKAKRRARAGSGRS